MKIKLSFSKEQLKTLWPPLLAALCFSTFIYLNHLGLNLPLVETAFALIAFWYILNAPKKPLFFFGAFSGIFWFYWMALSFRFYDLLFLVPLVILFLGVTYGLLFYLLGFLKHAYLRAPVLLFFSYIHPFGFNWFKPELALINTPFGTGLYPFAFILAGLLVIRYAPNYFRLLAILPLALAMDFSPSNAPLMPALKIKITQTDIKQNQKWKPQYRQGFIQDNYTLIEKAIDEKYDLIILPESAFPMHLNFETRVLEQLESYSHDIAIITGALHYKNNRFFNSTYFFQNGEMQIADKVVLVPFGERVPLPKFITVWINKVFFNGAEDYSVAEKPTDFTIKGEIFRNAICYEATDERLFEGNPRYMIAISNNAWFLPSTEATLQSLLLQYYANKHQSVIFHSANGEKSTVIQPMKKF